MSPLHFHAKLYRDGEANHHCASNTPMSVNEPL